MNYRFRDGVYTIDPWEMTVLRRTSMNPLVAACIEENISRVLAKDPFFHLSMAGKEVKLEWLESLFKNKGPSGLAPLIKDIVVFGLCVVEYPSIYRDTSDMKATETIQGMGHMINSGRHFPSDLARNLRDRLGMEQREIESIITNSIKGIEPVGKAVSFTPQRVDPSCQIIKVQVSPTGRVVDVYCTDSVGGVVGERNNNLRVFYDPQSFSVARGMVNAITVSLNSRISYVVETVNRLAETERKCMEIMSIKSEQNWFMTSPPPNSQGGYNTVIDNASGDNPVHLEDLNRLLGAGNTAHLEATADHITAVNQMYKVYSQQFAGARNQNYRYFGRDNDGAPVPMPYVLPAGSDAKFPSMPSIDAEIGNSISRMRMDIVAALGLTLPEIQGMMSRMGLSSEGRNYETINKHGSSTGLYSHKLLSDKVQQLMAIIAYDCIKSEMRDHIKKISVDIMDKISPKEFESSSSESEEDSEGEEGPEKKTRPQRGSARQISSKELKPSSGENEEEEEEEERPEKKTRLRKGSAKLISDAIYMLIGVTTELKESHAPGINEISTLLSQGIITAEEAREMVKNTNELYDKALRGSKMPEAPPVKPKEEDGEDSPSLEQEKKAPDEKEEKPPSRKGKTRKPELQEEEAAREEPPARPAKRARREINKK